MDEYKEIDDTGIDKDLAPVIDISILNSMIERNIVIEVQNRLLDKELKLINSINTQIVDTQGNFLIEIPNDSWYISLNGNRMFEFRGYMFVLKPPLNNHGTYFLDQVFCKCNQ